MIPCFSSTKRAALAAFVAASAIAAIPAQASLFGVAAINTPIYASSDQGPLVVTPFLLTNDTGYNLDLTDLGSLVISYNTGNPNDQVTVVSFDNDVSGNGVGNCYVDDVLAKDGGSCTLELLITDSALAPDMTNHLAYGVSNITLTGLSSESGNGQASYTADDSYFRTYVEYTPEPESLVLLGTGLLGMAGAGWRKRKSLRA